MSALTQRLIDTGTTIAAVGAGLTGGVLFGFSAFVMRALDRLPADRAIEAMQSINRQAPRAGRMTAMFGTAAVSAAIGIDGLRRLDEPAGRLVTAGAAAYLASIVVTIVFHVPRNDRLATVVTPAQGATGTWQRYSSSWTAGNHLRVALAIAASVLFTLACSGTVSDSAQPRPLPLTVHRSRSRRSASSASSTGRENIGQWPVGRSGNRTSRMTGAAGVVAEHRAVRGGRQSRGSSSRCAKHGDSPPRSAGSVSPAGPRRFRCAGSAVSSCEC